jgi:hypothetical protein
MLRSIAQADIRGVPKSIAEGALVGVVGSRTHSPDHGSGVGLALRVWASAAVKVMAELQELMLEDGPACIPLSPPRINA